MKRNNYSQLSSSWQFSGDRTLAFLLRCLYPNSSDRTVVEIQQKANSQIDWERLVAVARAHYVLAPLYRRLVASCSDQVPPPILEDMHRRYQDLVVQNLLLTNELVALLKLMATNGIDAMPYKGPMLAQALYDEVDLRAFGDLDIIIQPEDMQAAEKLLVEAGYRHYLSKKTAAELAVYMQSKAEHTYDFFHDAKGVLVEVHWRFWPVYFSAVHPSQVWQQRQPATINGWTTSTLTIEDYLLILCMHGSRHLWLRLSWLYDIAALLYRYPDLNWDDVLGKSEQWGCQRMLNLGLYLAHQWFKATLPPEITQRVLSDKRACSLSEIVDQKIFSASPARFMNITRYQLQVRERLQDKVAYSNSLVYWLSKDRPKASI